MQYLEETEYYKDVTRQRKELFSLKFFVVPEVGVIAVRASSSAGVQWHGSLFESTGNYSILVRPPRH